MEGLRVELVVPDPPDCPIAEAAEGEDASARTVARTRGDTPVTEEAVLNGVEEPPDGAEAVYEDGEEAVYRFERETDGCVCETVESHSCPVVDARVREGDLHLAFHVRDRDGLTEVIEDLRDSYPSVSLRRVTAADGADADGYLACTDELTERQREALETAHRMGYFDHPKDANATDVADEMGIAPSTFTEHLSAAQRKLLDELLR